MEASAPFLASSIDRATQMETRQAPVSTEMLGGVVFLHTKIGQDLSRVRKAKGKWKGAEGGAGTRCLAGNRWCTAAGLQNSGEQILEPRGTILQIGRAHV